MLTPTPARDAASRTGSKGNGDAPSSASTPRTIPDSRTRHQIFARSESFGRELRWRIVAALCNGVHILLTEAIIDMCSVPLGLAILSCIPSSGDSYPATSQPMTLAISATYAWIILALSFLRFLTPLLLALCFTQCPVDLLHRLYDAYCVGKIGALNGPSVIRVALLHILKAVGVALTFIVARLPTGSDPVPGPILAPSQAITSMLVGPSVIRVALLHILKAVGVALTFIVARLPTGSDPVPGPILAPSQAITSMLVGKFTIYVVRVWLVSQGRLARDNFEDPDCESDEDGRDECPGNNCEHHRPSKLV